MLMYNHVTINQTTSGVQIRGSLLVLESMFSEMSRLFFFLMLPLINHYPGHRHAKPVQRLPDTFETNDIATLYLPRRLVLIIRADGRLMQYWASSPTDASSIRNRRSS